MGIDVNTTTNLYFVADTGNNRIQSITTALVFSAKIGTSGTGDDNFKYPMDIACDTAGGYIYVADTYNHRYHLREDDLSYVGDVGTEGYRRDQFAYPGGICLYGRDLYITEQGNHRVAMRDYLEGSAGDYELMGVTDTVTPNSYRVRGGLAGGEKYRVSVVSVGLNKRKKMPVDGVTDTVTIADRTTVPPDPVTFTATNAGAGMVRLTWSGGTCFDFAGYEVRCGTAWSNGTVLGLTRESTFMAPYPIGAQSRTYYVAGKTTSDVYSSTPASVVYTAPPPNAPIRGGLGTNYAV
jgi:DNA-binding beta-propeller fold protein YncE